MDEYKKRIEKVINNFSKRNDPTRKTVRSKKNEKPESVFVKSLVSHLKNRGFSVSVIESKAVFSKGAGRYLGSNAPPGHSDIAGNDPDGIGVFIEAKAPGKKENLSIKQYLFLSEKIDCNCFAICTDSIEHFEAMYKMFKNTSDSGLRKKALMSDIRDPSQKIRRKKITKEAPQ